MARNGMSSGKHDEAVNHGAETPISLALIIRVFVEMRLDGSR